MTSFLFRRRQSALSYCEENASIIRLDIDQRPLKVVAGRASGPIPQGFEKFQISFLVRQRDMSRSAKNVNSNFAE